MIARPKTKILVTFGPACDSTVKIKKFLHLGVRAFRFNMKHSDTAWHEQKMKFLRQIAEEMGVSVCIVMDLQGPEIRAVGTKDVFKDGETITMAIKGKVDILIDKEEVIRDVKEGDDLFIDDGRLKFKVLGKTGKQIKLRVIEGGSLGGRKSVNLPGVNLGIKSLAERDFGCLSLGNRLDIDYVALSFVRDKKDILDLKNELKKRKMNADVIAKIETQQALDNIDEIIDASEGIMVARGDLGIEIPMEQIPLWQKTIIKKCLSVGKPVITATHMLESMINNPVPTRAEISDVGNAILDKTDVIMLSGETASGKHPVEAVEWMTRSAFFLEDNRNLGSNDNEFIYPDQTAAITEAACELEKNIEGIKGFVVLTESGYTAKMLSRFRSKTPIYVFTHKKSTRDKLHLVWGVMPYLFNYQRLSEEQIRKMTVFLNKEGIVKKGEKLILICGNDWGIPGRTNMLRVLEV